MIHLSARQEEHHLVGQVGLYVHQPKQYFVGLISKSFPQIRGYSEAIVLSSSGYLKIMVKLT